MALAMTASTTKYGHRKVFLSQMAPLSVDRSVAILLVGVSATIFVMLIPFAKVSLLPIPAFIFMSGHSENAAQNHNNDLAAPNAHVLSKPFRKIDLALRVREVLGGG
jgi:hypothetical protein